MYIYLSFTYFFNILQQRSNGTNVYPLQSAVLVLISNLNFIVWSSRITSSRNWTSAIWYQSMPKSKQSPILHNHQEKDNKHQKVFNCETKEKIRRVRFLVQSSSSSSFKWKTHEEFECRSKKIYQFRTVLKSSWNWKYELFHNKKMAKETSSRTETTRKQRTLESDLQRYSSRCVVTW